jgi:hypothetical protein
MIKKYGFNIFTLIAASFFVAKAVSWLLLVQNQLTIFTTIVATGLLLAEINHLFLNIENNKLKGVSKCDPLSKSLEK